MNKFDLHDKIDVVAKNGDRILVKTMTYGDALELDKSDWKLEFFQVGFHSYKSTE